MGLSSVVMLPIPSDPIRPHLIPSGPFLRQVMGLSSVVILACAGHFSSDPAVVAQMVRILPLMATTLSIHGTAVTLEGYLLARRAFGALGLTYAFVAASVAFLLRLVRISSDGLLSGLGGVWLVYVWFQIVRIAGFAWGGGLLRWPPRPAAPAALPADGA